MKRLSRPGLPRKLDHETPSIPGGSGSAHTCKGVSGGERRDYPRISLTNAHLLTAVVAWLNDELGPQGFVALSGIKPSAS